MITPVWNPIWYDLIIEKVPEPYTRLLKHLKGTDYLGLVGLFIQILKPFRQLLQVFCLQTPRQVEYSDWLVGSVVVLDLVGCVKLGLSCRFDDASSGELAVSSEAVNAERKFLAGHIG